MLTKDPTEYTGLETYVSEMVEEEDMNFYPLDKALCMEDDAEEEEDPFHVEVESKLLEMEQNARMLKSVLAEIKTDANVNQAIQMDMYKKRFALVDSMRALMGKYGGKINEMQMKQQVTQSEALIA